MPLCDVADLRVMYGKAVAVSGISFVIERGEFVALVGPNGAGKTSTLRALSRLIPSFGVVKLDGHELPASAVGTVRAGLVHCPERRRLFPGLTVHDNLLLGAHRRKREGGVDEDLTWVFDVFPVLRERRTQLAGTMSGGEQQQLAIARALMARPALLLLDEPSLGLASIVKEAIVRAVLRLKERGITTLLVEQDVHFAFRCADRVLVLEHGHIVRDGPTEEVARDPAVRAAYLGI